MAKKTQLSPTATPGKRYSFIAKAGVGVAAKVKYFWRVAFGALADGEI